MGKGRRKRGTVPLEAVENIVAAYKAGASIANLAHDFNVTSKEMTNTLLAGGAVLRPRGRPVGWRKPQVIEVPKENPTDASLVPTSPGSDVTEQTVEARLTEPLSTVKDHYVKRY